MQTRIVLLGATGLVGNLVLRRLLADAGVTIIAPTRRPLDIDAPQLRNPVLDFAHLAEAARDWPADAAICALGTTMKQAGSRDAFRRVDHTYPLLAAQALRAGGCGTFVLNSAAGADPASRLFYSRVKGELERDLRAVAFPSLTLVRPGFIGGARAQPRPLEQAASLVLGALGPVLPRALRINPATRIATTLVEAARVPVPGVHVVGPAALADAR